MKSQLRADERRRIPMSNVIPQRPHREIADRASPVWIAILSNKGDLESLLSSLLTIAGCDVGKVAPGLEECLGKLHSPCKAAQNLQALHHRRSGSRSSNSSLRGNCAIWRLRDDLTCLYNRQGFFAAATQLLKFARRNDQQIMLFSCGVNNLKQINELFGREEGEFALVRTADALEEVFRESDLLARLGDDQFVVLASGASGIHQDAVLAAWRVAFSGRMRANRVSAHRQCRCGCSSTQNHPVKLSELMELAESAMNERKQRRSF